MCCSLLYNINHFASRRMTKLLCRVNLNDKGSLQNLKKTACLMYQILDQFDNYFLTKGVSCNMKVAFIIVCG